MELTTAVDAVVSEVLEEFEVTTSVAGVLWALDPESEPPTMRDLAKRLHCDPSTVSLTADKLQAAGLVTRQPHARDRRKRTLVLTDDGHALWGAMSARLQASDVLSGLDEQDRDDLLRILAKTAK
jgi:DNA-binding MarR family transcriptional regulator